MEEQTTTQKTTNQQFGGFTNYPPTPPLPLETYILQKPKRNWLETLALFFLGLIIGGFLISFYDAAKKYQPLVERDKRVYQTICGISVKQSSAPDAPELKMPLAIGLNSQEMSVLPACKNKTNQ